MLCKHVVFHLVGGMLECKSVLLHCRHDDHLLVLHLVGGVNILFPELSFLRGFLYDFLYQARGVATLGSPSLRPAVPPDEYPKS